MRRVRCGPVRARLLMPPLALLLAACAATDVPPPTDAADAASPFAGCAALSAPAPAVSAASTATASLPDLSLPCFTGGGPVRLLLAEQHEYGAGPAAAGGRPHRGEILGTRGADPGQQRLPPTGETVGAPAHPATATPVCARTSPPSARLSRASPV